MPERRRHRLVGSQAARALLSASEGSLGEREGSWRAGWVGRNGQLPGRVDDAALHSTATVWYESTAAPRFGAASIRILMPGGAGTTTVGRRAQLSGVDGGCDASLRTSPGGEGIGGRLTGSCSVLLSRAQASRNRALVGARDAISATRSWAAKTALPRRCFNVCGDDRAAG